MILLKMDLYKNQENLKNTEHSTREDEVLIPKERIMANHFLPITIKTKVQAIQNP